MNDPANISVVDDDESVRESLESLLKSVGFQVQLYPSAESFLAAPEKRVDCLILDVRLGGMSGIELHHALTMERRAVPTIFITGHGDATMRARVKAEGAVDCLSKPFEDEALLSCVETALRGASPRHSDF
ncbi:response regulator transcription factor [Cerasicoccus frondis]|uniref:response regulator transcription factor n=1 Tax=Cerasicoccus frondis TaxID=490090 RepID=UPI002852C2E9|nr:response regulator [Cerasicoccus frondis]